MFNPLLVDRVLVIFHKLIFGIYFLLNGIAIAWAWVDFFRIGNSFTIIWGIIFWNLWYIAMLGILQSLFGDCPIIYFRRKLNPDFKKPLRMLWKLRPTLGNRILLFGISLVAMALLLIIQPNYDLLQ